MADAPATVSQPPVEAGRAAHSAPSRSTPVAPHSSASLGGLPDEIKQLVARYVYLATLEGDAKDQDERVPVIGYFAKMDEADRARQNCEHSPKRGLCRLSLVERSFRAVCLPLLFEDLELREGDTAHGYAQRFLDCNARHIRHLTCTFVSLSHHQIAGPAPVPVRSGESKAVAFENAICDIFATCGGVTTLKLFLQTPSRSRCGMMYRTARKKRVVDVALSQMGPTIRRLQLVLCETMEPTLNQLPSTTALQSLSIQFEPSSTLTALNLGLDGGSIDSLPLPAYNLPHLKALVFSFPYPSALTDAFPPNSAPLAIVHLSHIHDVDFALADIVQFLEAHARTLQRVHVGGTDQDDDDWAPLGVSPHAVEQLLQLGEDLDIEITGLVSDGPRLPMAVPMGVLG